MVSQINFPQRDVGYLIRSIDYGEDHRILSFLTRERGRLDAIALGAKKSLKRFGPALDFLNRLSLEFDGNLKSGLHRLSQVELLGTHPLVRRDYDRTWMALEWIKLLAQALREQGPVPGLFEILDRHLAALGDTSPERVDHAFQFNLLRTLGYSLELTRCARCHGAPQEVASFVPREGGLFCASCHSPQASEIRAHFFPIQWWESPADKADAAPVTGDPTAMLEQEKVLAEALAFFLAIPPPEADRQKGRKTTRNHSHEFRVVGRKVGGLKKRTDKK